VTDQERTPGVYPGTDGRTRMPDAMTFRAPPTPAKTSVRLIPAGLLIWARDRVKRMPPPPPSYAVKITEDAPRPRGYDPELLEMWVAAEVESVYMGPFAGPGEAAAWVEANAVLGNRYKTIPLKPVSGA
jgi:hypothetical protein